MGVFAIPEPPEIWTPGTWPPRRGVHRNPRGHRETCPSTPAAASGTFRRRRCRRFHRRPPPRRLPRRATPVRTAPFHRLGSPGRRRRGLRRQPATTGRSRRLSAIWPGWPRGDGPTPSATDGPQTSWNCPVRNRRSVVWTTSGRWCK